MQGILRLVGPIGIWVLFFIADLYGHVILKKTIGRDASGMELFHRVLGSWWGWTIFLAWGLAGLLWICVLSKNTLFQTNSISMMSYVLICFSAVLFLGENPTQSQWLGMGFISLGVYLAGK